MSSSLGSASALGHAPHRRAPLDRHVLPDIVVSELVEVARCAPALQLLRQRHLLRQLRILFRRSGLWAGLAQVLVVGNDQSLEAGVAGRLRADRGAGRREQMHDLSPFARGNLGGANPTGLHCTQ